MYIALVYRDKLYTPIYAIFSSGSLCGIFTSDEGQLEASNAELKWIRQIILFKFALPAKYPKLAPMNRPVRTSSLPCNLTSGVSGYG